MFCSKCGTKLADDAKFCSGCGKQIGGTSVDTQQVAPANDETEIAHAKIGLAVNPGTFSSQDVGTGILTNKRLVLKQATFMGLTIPLANLLVEGKSVFEISYEDMKEAHIKKKMMGNILIVTTKTGDEIHIYKQGMSSSFLDEWCDIINQHVK